MPVAQPQINQIRNAAGLLPPGAPHYAIARGSVFRLTGASLAAEGTLTQAASTGLDRNFGGVAIQITVAGTTNQAIPYSVSPGHVILYGASSNGANPSLFTQFNCAERVEAGRFTVPADVLSSMVPSFVSW
jgi:hypothetical protein